MSELTTRAVTSFQEWDELPANQSPLYMCSYQQLIQEPIKTVQAIYRRFGMDFSPEASQNMRTYLKDHPQNKHGRHEYSLQQYGLTFDDVRRECSVYEKYMESKGYKSEDII